MLLKSSWRNLYVLLAIAPEQVRILTLGDEEPLVTYAKGILAELRANFVRADSDFGTDKINGKIQRAEEAKVHTMLVIGKRDMDAGNVSVRLHGKGNLGVFQKSDQNDETQTNPRN